MVLEIKYVNANNTVIHTENSKLLLDLNCNPKELEKTVVNSCGIEHSLHSGVFRTIQSSCTMWTMSNQVTRRKFLGKLQVLVKAFNIHSKKSAVRVRETRSSVHEAIDMVDEVLEYVKSCSRRARELQSLARETIDGRESTLSNKCLKSLEVMAQSLRKVENNIKDLSSYPGFEVNLNLESLLTLNVENQHAVTHFNGRKQLLSTNTHSFWFIRWRRSKE